MKIYPLFGADCWRVTCTLNVKSRVMRLLNVIKGKTFLFETLCIERLYFAQFFIFYKSIIE